MKDWENLANGIVNQACLDYVLIKSDIIPWSPNNNEKELIHFFKSDWFRTLTTLDPEYLINKLDTIVKKMDRLIYDYRVVKGVYQVYDRSDPETVLFQSRNAWKAVVKASDFQGIPAKYYGYLRRCYHGARKSCRKDLAAQEANSNT